MLPSCLAFLHLDLGSFSVVERVDRATAGGRQLIALDMLFGSNSRPTVYQLDKILNSIDPKKDVDGLCADLPVVLHVLARRVEHACTSSDVPVNGKKYES